MKIVLTNGEFKTGVKVVRVLLKNIDETSVDLGTALSLLSQVEEGYYPAQKNIDDFNSEYKGLFIAEILNDEISLNINEEVVIKVTELAGDCIDSGFDIIRYGIKTIKALYISKIMPCITGIHEIIASYKA